MRLVYVIIIAVVVVGLLVGGGVCRTGTEAYQSVIDCEELGYPHDFCLRIPLEVLPARPPRYVELVPGQMF
jgi:hypothetical protein